jgi:hypothetical protein
MLPQVGILTPIAHRIAADQAQQTLAISAL